MLIVVIRGSVAFTFYLEGSRDTDRGAFCRGLRRSTRDIEM